MSTSLGQILTQNCSINISHL